MKAFCIAAPQNGGFIEQEPPRLGPEEVAIEPRRIGLCGSDLNTWRGLNPMVAYPRVPGHEIAGVIEAKGEAVPDSIRLGALATVSPYAACGSCPPCRSGRANACQFNQTLGVQRDGALAQRMSVHWTKTFQSEALGLDELALVEPLSVGYHAANRARIAETDIALVIGCGAVGMGAVAAAARKGARVAAVDLDPAKLAAARALGAAWTIQSDREDPVERVKKLSGGEGASAVIEAVGAPATYRLAIECAAYGARVALIGYSQAPVEFETKQFVAKELDIMGSRNALGEFRSTLAMMEARERPFELLIGRTYAFAETERAFRDWAANPSGMGKILIDMER